MHGNTALNDAEGHAEGERVEVQVVLKDEHAEQFHEISTELDVQYEELAVALIEKELEDIRAREAGADYLSERFSKLQAEREILPALHKHLGSGMFTSATVLAVEDGTIKDLISTITDGNLSPNTLTRRLKRLAGVKRVVDENTTITLDEMNNVFLISNID